MDFSLVDWASVTCRNLKETVGCVAWDFSGYQLSERSETEITVVLKKICPLLLSGNSIKRIEGDTSCFRNSWQVVTGPAWVGLGEAALQGKRISYILGFTYGHMCSPPLGSFAAASVWCRWFLCWLIWNKILLCLPYLSRSFETLWGGNPLLFFFLTLDLRPVKKLDVKSD